MSRVGKTPIPIPKDAKVKIDGGRVTITGPKGELSRVIYPTISAAVEDGNLVVTRPNDLKKNRALHGLTRALLNNMMVGVTTGYILKLKIIGVGYRAEMKGPRLILNLGYSHPIVMALPEGVAITVEPKENVIKIEGIDKELVGQTAAKIRSFRKPEPYKGKGVRYIDEIVRTKAGKTAGV
ncbi:MAG: 50S ribosomal protein L6 [candidate division Zixibacteria bacterium]|nr:50S ribosomal protein L6 [candidate division Zixibacteria bacterium]